MWTVANLMYWKNTNSLHLRLAGLVSGGGSEQRGMIEELQEFDDLVEALPEGKVLAVSVVYFLAVHFDGVFV